MKSEQDNTQETVISEEALSKAYAILDLETPEVQEEVIEKSENADSLENLSSDELDAREAELKKSLGDIEAFKAAQAGSAEEIKKGEGAEEEEEEEEEEMKKGNMKKGEANDELVKAITEAVGGQFKGFKDSVDEKFKAVGTITKGFEGRMADMEGRLNEFLGQSEGRKSVTTQKQHIIEKSFDNEGGADDTVNYVSISQSKAKISKALTEDGSWEKNEELRKAIVSFDMTSQASPIILKKAKELGMTLIP